MFLLVFSWGEGIGRIAHEKRIFSTSVMMLALYMPTMRCTRPQVRFVISFSL